MDQNLYLRLLKLCKERLASAKTKLSRMKIKHPGKWLTLVNETAQTVVGTVEEVSQQLKGVTGAQKKQAAVDLMLWLVQDIKGVPAWIKSELIGKIIDAVVALFNAHGHDWPTWLYTQAKKAVSWIKKLFGKGK